MSAIITNLNAVRAHFETGGTQSIDVRKEHLKKLKAAILKNEDEINEALYKDLHKSKEEIWLTETGMVISEIDHCLKNLRKWMKPKKVSTNLLNLPGKSMISPEPLGVALIIGPWNYPFQLSLVPLVGAIAAGNCAVVKPSEYAVHTAEVIAKIMSETFSADYILCVNGDGASVVPEMMNNFRFDHVFFTGGTAVGRLIYKMAADKLVPVTLELGGKSPCVVTENANLKVAAKRIASIKFSNAGQMCIAPDYLLVQESVKDKFLPVLKEAIKNFYGDKPEKSYDFGRIVNEKQFQRLTGYLSEGHITLGGEHSRDELYIAPTILEDVSVDDPVMQEEIFGPLLPVLSYRSEEEALGIIKKNPDPLAFYVFTDKNKEADRWLQNVPSGNAAVNVAALFYLNKNLPFGGRGDSGAGRYHGKFSFDTFSHQKAVLKRPTWPDFAVAYPSYKGKLGILKKFI